MGNSCCSCQCSTKDNTSSLDIEEGLIENEDVPFIHGLLLIHVIEADGLPDMDTAFFNICQKDVTDPYVTCKIGDATLFTTKYIFNSLSPIWDETFKVLVCHHGYELEFKVKDKEHIGAKAIGKASILIEDILENPTQKKWFDILRGEEIVGRILLNIAFFPHESEENIGSIEDSYFLPRTGNRVVLYQDADTPLLPVFHGLNDCLGDQYVPPRAWMDIYQAINEAEKFIYIIGWSVATHINLVRGDEDPNGVSNIGELLKRKADEGVKVLLMIWNEKLSTDNTPGLMGTHDEETRAYFEGTAVECLTVGRVKYESALASEFVSSCYTHHQKTVICDAPRQEDSMKKIVAFIGGLDITDGRYDSPQFPLFSSINTPYHCQDFYNNCVTGVTKEVGPREPWHDCHAKVEGPIAIDIKRNFEERWRRQGSYFVNRLYIINEDEFDIESEAQVPPGEGGPWTVQLFRSITSDSCIFDFERQHTLQSKYGRIVEDSILRALVIQIRRAKRFVYIENQYFLGSSYSWLANRETRSPHIVPRELCQKIIDKINAKERFMVYILIPMFPEGDPLTAPIQEILYYQYRTMQSMYVRISRAIKAAGINAHPTDYLNFYCLGKRESPSEVPFEELCEPEEGTLPHKLRDTLRHSIYVHSKLTIIDDQYVIVGSANINQRSLDGNRDSEIAIGAYQESALAQDNPREGVHQYRMALWQAHLGGYDDAFLNPSSMMCLNKVREITENNWRNFVNDEAEHSDVHMLPYPLKITEDGDVVPLQEPFDCFPDTTASVIGALSGYLPAKLTT